MTRDEQREQKAIKLQAQKQAKMEAKQDKQESKAFARSIEKWKEKGAWEEETETQLTNQ